MLHTVFLIFIFFNLDYCSTQNTHFDQLVSQAYVQYMKTTTSMKTHCSQAALENTFLLRRMLRLKEKYTCYLSQSCKKPDLS